MTNPAAPSIPRRDHAAAVERLMVPVDVPAPYADKDYTDDLAYLCALLLPLLANGLRRKTLARRITREGAYYENEP